MSPKIKNRLFIPLEFDILFISIASISLNMCGLRNNMTGRKVTFILGYKFSSKRICSQKTYECRYKQQIGRRRLCNMLTNIIDV